MGDASEVCVSDTRGMSTPLLVKSTSSPAEEFGAAPVELIPTFWVNAVALPSAKKQATNILFLKISLRQR